MFSFSFCCPSRLKYETRTRPTTLTVVCGGAQRSVHTIFFVYIIDVSIVACHAKIWLVYDWVEPLKPCVLLVA